MGAVITFLNTYGTFILTAISVAYVFALTFFPALLALIGPEGETGKLDYTKLVRSEKEKAYLNAEKAGATGSERGSSPAEREGRKPALTVGGCGIAVLAVLTVLFIFSREEEVAKEKKATGAATDAVYLPTASEIGDGWHELKPGGRTSCSRGATWSFFFKKADSSTNRHQAVSAAHAELSPHYRPDLIAASTVLDVKVCNAKSPPPF